MSALHTPYPYELATEHQRAIGSLWWCIHHDRKLEPLTEPVETRVNVIRETKSLHEWGTRLRALRPLTSPLPEWLKQAAAEWSQADAERRKAAAEWSQAAAECSQAAAEWRQAAAEWRQALRSHAGDIDRMWVAECADVPWGPHGLIFPEAT